MTDERKTFPGFDPAKHITARVMRGLPEGVWFLAPRGVGYVLADVNTSLLDNGDGTSTILTSATAELHLPKPPPPEYRCRSCREWVPESEWVDFDQDCDACGCHTAYRCPRCNHIHDDPSDGLDSLEERATSSAPR